jgi:hypothetical protein
LVLVAALVGCATTTPGGPPAGAAAESMKYGGGDGTSCEQAVVIHEKSEMAGIAAEYAWLKARYPGYRRGPQSLSKCGDRPADKIEIRTADGRELAVVFDISEFFGRM